MENRNGTSMISLIVPPKGQIALVNRMLTDEYGTASNIKSRVNRLSVLSAITSTQQRLKLYNRIPDNGLVIYCGTVVTDDGKEKKVSRDFEPFRPINSSLYLCVDGDAVVATGSGAGRRLRSVVAAGLPERVLTASAEDPLLRVASVSQGLRKGLRDCVAVELEDGRELICTPDHALLVERLDGAREWVQALDLAPSDRVLCGLDAPVDEDEEESAGADENESSAHAWELDVLHSPVTPAERARLLALARLCGMLSVEGGGSRLVLGDDGRWTATVRVAHRLDLASVQMDIARLCGGETGRVVVGVSPFWEVHCPPALSELLASAGISQGRPQWPKWVEEEHVPQCVLREMVAAALGAAGKAPSMDGQGRLCHEVVFESAEEAPARILACLLGRLGVEAKAHKGEVRVEAGMAQVGFRHNVQKQARHTAAAVYQRSRELRGGRPLESFASMMGRIGAQSLFSTEDGENGRRSEEVPLLKLNVAGVRSAGERTVYDLSVANMHTFTANGMVVHNCDNKFHTEPLRELLEDDEKFGFVIMDGSGTLFGTLSGNTREVLHRLTVELPKKHGRGGQSALRFARLRVEKRHNYLRKVAEIAVQCFITNDKVNVSGLILAGLADFKNELSQTDMFDMRLKKKVIKIVDVSYGGDNGFNQAIELSADALKDVKFVKEKKLIGNFMDQLARDTGRYAIGLVETLAALEMGSVETLIVWEGCELERITYRNTVTSEERIQILSQQQKEDPRFQRDADGNSLEVVDSVHFLEWLSENYIKFGAHLEFVSDKSEEGNQFVKGFGGIGAILRYQVDNALLQNMDAVAEDAAIDDADDWDL